jgi:GT2 family glycosyltransferase
VIKVLLNRFKECFQYSIDLTLLPFSNTERDLNGAWTWTGDTPQIELLADSAITFQGFYMLELQITDLKHSVNSCLCAGNNKIFTDDFSYSLPITRVSPGSKTVKRICYFEQRVDSFLFIPSDVEGGCAEVSLKLIKLPAFRARQLMCKKLLINTHEKSIQALYRNYDRLFNKINTSDYASWIANYECEISSVEVQNQLSGLARHPCISIVCPVYNTKPEWLIACVESVKNQYYPNWELILVDDASSKQDHFDLLKQYEVEQNNIHVIYLKENCHISAATNAGIDIAIGEYVTFLDHDDELALNALYEVCKVVNQYPDAKIIYSDEDLMSEEGVRVAPHFKSDWNLELLRAHNYVTHLCVYDKALVDKLGGMRLGYEGAQDYDLILRASSITTDKQIHHISKILYHWRMVEGSTALSSGAKSYTTQAGFSALSDYLKNNNLDAKVEYSDRDNFYTVKYALPAELPLVSIIIPTRDGMEVLRPCIESLIEKTDYSNYEVVILDNGSEKEETLRFLEELSLKSNFKIVRDGGGFNYSRINNKAVEYSEGDLVCLLNNDIEIIDKNWLKEMVSIAIREEVGCVGAKLLYPDGTIQHAGVILGLGGYAAHSHRGLDGNAPGYFCRAQLRQQLSSVTGACLLIRREAYNEVNGMDESFQVAYNDVDFCLRIQALGYQNIYTPFATLLHHESKTRGADDSPMKTQRFDQEKALLLTRWSEIIKNDPFYNINLTRSREDFSIGELQC